MSLTLAWRTPQSFEGPRGGCEGGVDTKVAELHESLFGEEDVGGFDVAVEHALVVQVA